MATMQGTLLPYDLQDQIIGHLREDLESLAVCSLVSSLWSEHARMLLFSSLQVHIAYNTLREEERTTELIALLGVPHSRLWQYIQRVSIKGPDDFLVVDESVRARLVELGAYDILSSALQFILPRLSRVHTLKIDAITWYWIPRDVQVQIGVMSQVKSLSWTRINVDRVDDFIQFSRENFPELEEFKVSELGGKEPGLTMFPRCTDRLMSLRNLTVLVEESTVPLILALTSNIISVQNIDTLDVEVRDVAFFGHVDSLLKAIGPTLTTLTIWVKLNFRSFIDFPLNKTPFSLSANVNLQSLSLVSDYYPSEVPYWKGILRSNPAIRELVEIRLLLSLGTSQDGYHDFSLLEDVLLMQKAPSVRIVMECYTVDAPGFSEALKRSIQELSKHAQVSVVSECWDAENPFYPEPSVTPPPMLSRTA